MAITGVVGEFDIYFKTRFILKKDTVIFRYNSGTILTTFDAFCPPFEHSVTEFRPKSN